MTKIGSFAKDPKLGGYGKLSLDSGEKILVHHDQGGFKGGGVRSPRKTPYSRSSPRAWTGPVRASKNASRSASSVSVSPACPMSFTRGPMSR